MNEEPGQMPLAPPEGLVAVNPQNIEVGKRYFIVLVEIENGEVVPNDRWDYVSLSEATPESITYDRIKTLMEGPHGNFWYTLDPVDNPYEEMYLTYPRDAFIESTVNQPDGQYFIFYTVAPPLQAAGRRSRRRRRSDRRSTRRRRSRRVASI